jgi:lipoprotein NlpD
MLVSLIKIQRILFLSLLFPLTVCQAEDNGPVKFYDGVDTKSEKQKAKIKKNAISNPLKNNSDDLVEQELEQATTLAQQKSLSPKPPIAESTSLDGIESQIVKKYVIKKNETLFAIANRFNVSKAQLATWNNITSPNQVYAGQILKIFKYKQKHSNLKSLKNEPKTAKNSREVSQKTSIISTNNKNMLKFYCQWPTEGKIIKNFSQSHGKGIEISGKLGQSIKAIAAGQIVAVSAGIYGHGGFIVIRHENQYLSSYVNNKRALVKNGQTVTQGQVIAEMGKVGRKRPSLQLQIRKNGKLVDPMRFLPKKI